MTVASATRKALAEADRTLTPLGQAAITLAKRLDSPATPAAAVGALGRELRLTLIAALENSKAAADPIDELQKQRERRRRGA